VAVQPPHRQDEVVTPECAIPGESVLVVRVDERAVEIEQRRLAQEAASVFSR
jgi:hypothetical protein